MSDIRRNIEKLQPALHFVHWNQQGWKTGLCSVPPIGQVSSFLKVHARCSVSPVEEVYLFVCLFVWFVYLFVCLFVLFCFVCVLEYMPGALCHLFVLFVYVLSMFSQSAHAYLYPPMDDWLCLLLPVLKRRLLNVVLWTLFLSPILC